MSWPDKCQVLGVKLSVTDYGAAVAAICEAARSGRGGAVGAISIQGVMLGTVQSKFGELVNALDITGIAPR